MIKPLRGRRVLFLRPREEADELSRIIYELGGEPIHLELIQRGPPTDWSALESVLSRLDGYDWIVFTSKAGVRAFVERATNRGVDLSRIRGRVAAVGPATAKEAEKKGLKVSFTPSKYLTKTLAEQLPDVSGKRVLLVRSEGVDDLMARIFEMRGAVVEQVPAYKVSTVDCPATLPQFDVVILTSPSTAEALKRALDSHGGALREDVIVCCIGPVTAMAAEELGLRAHIVAERHTAGGVVEALVRGLNPC
ncbi:MAG: uroporphyrinogen-III synthase [Nitrososphaerota archaeon]